MKRRPGVLSCLVLLLPLVLACMAKGQERCTWKGHKSSLSSVAFSPDGKTLASAGGDHVILLWDVVRGTRQATLPHSASIRVAEFSPDGKTLAAATGEWRGSKSIPVVKLWDVKARRVRATLENAGMALAFAPDGKLLATGAGTQDNSVKLWDPATGKLVAILKGHKGYVVALAFALDGKTLASGTWGDGVVKLWDVARRQARLTIAAHPATPMHSVGLSTLAFSPDGKTVATGGEEPPLKLWDAATGKLRAAIKTFGLRVDGVRFSPDGKLLALGGAGSLQFFDATTYKPVAALEGDSWICAVAFSPDGKTVATGCWNKTVKLWDVPTDE